MLLNEKGECSECEKKDRTISELTETLAEKRLEIKRLKGNDEGAEEDPRRKLV